MRWTAVITYRTEVGPVDVGHELEELEELQDLVERGPSFYAIDSIKVTYNYGEDARLTIEEADAL